MGNSTTMECPTTPTKTPKTLADCLDPPSKEAAERIQERRVERPEPVHWRTAICSTLHNVLSASECQALISRAEAVGFEEALVNVGGGRQKYYPDYRHSDRCIIDDKVFATALFERIKEYLPQQYRDPSSQKPLQVSCLNERMRILKYKPGDFFQRHSDGRYDRPDGSETSRCTVMIYLNGGYEGGHTLIFADAGHESVPVPPEPGLVFVFDHVLQHESPPLARGVKYAIRTDLMFA